jgi:putative chitinase
MDLSLGHTRTILDECERQGLLRNQAAYVLATALWETARSMKPVVEAFWKSEVWRRRNLRYYPWHGRGFVQLTWEKNYRRAAHELGVPLDQNPSLALDPTNAAKVIVTGMREGWFTGKKLADYIDLRHSDFFNARRIVNGTDRAENVARFAREYDAELKRIGYGEVDEPRRGLEPEDGLPNRATPAPAPAPDGKAGLLAAILALIARLFERKTA